MKNLIQRQYDIANSILKDILVSYKNNDGRYGKHAYQIQKQECNRLHLLLKNASC